MPGGYEPVIGLEIHAQLLTRSKIFCACSTRFGDPPNSNVCPVCLGLPGALPVLNRRAVEFAIRGALAVGCRIQATSVFARKNYFYPDLPKGYQISQYELPLAVDGRLAFDDDGAPHEVRITRVHLEEDAGKLLHAPAGGGVTSLVDFNRSGVPLIEIVTEPDLRSAADAAAFFARLRTLLMYLQVNDGNMEEGSLRCDANVSVRAAGTDRLGTKTEVKNVNSFRFLQRALEFEIERQIDLLDLGAPVRQETRQWNAVSGRTESMRTKEQAHDYRYFPEPDLPPLDVSEHWLEEIRASLPELPEAKRRRFVEQYGLAPSEAAFLVQSRALADYFEETARLADHAKAAANWLMGEVARVLNARGAGIEAFPVSPAGLADLITLVQAGTISGSVAKGVFDTMLVDGRSAKEIVQAEGLAQISDQRALEQAIHGVLEANAGAVAQYRTGKSATFGFLVGQVMKATRGQGNPKLINELLKRALDRPA